MSRFDKLGSDLPPLPRQNAPYLCCLLSFLIGLAPAAVLAWMVLV